jgi:hypothetical protein
VQLPAQGVAAPVGTGAQPPSSPSVAKRKRHSKRKAEHGTAAAPSDATPLAPPPAAHKRPPSPSAASPAKRAARGPANGAAPSAVNGVGACGVCTPDTLSGGALAAKPGANASSLGAAVARMASTTPSPMAADTKSELSPFEAALLARIDRLEQMLAAGLSRQGSAA